MSREMRRKTKGKNGKKDKREAGIVNECSFTSPTQASTVEINVSTEVLVSAFPRWKKKGGKGKSKKRGKWKKKRNQKGRKGGKGERGRKEEKKNRRREKGKREGKENTCL